jgi:hypothetical protein
MSVIKCTQCHKTVDRENDAHIVIPNTNRVGYQRHRPTSFTHATCFEKLVIFNHEIRKRDETRTAAQVEEVMKRLAKTSE